MTFATRATLIIIVGCVAIVFLLALDAAPGTMACLLWGAC